MRFLISAILCLSCAFGLYAQSATGNMNNSTTYETATIGGGCFWCTEAIFQRLGGVISVTSGYSGGSVKNPTYEEVCTGNTGHAECIQIVFDPAQIGYKDILHIFWELHDPTTLNQQGADKGTQYRSIIFYHSPEQKKIAEEDKRNLQTSYAVFGKSVVTEIVPYQTFYPAETYHQNYFNNNGSQGYCRLVIQPKLEKFLQKFSDQVKK